MRARGERGTLAVSVPQLVWMADVEGYIFWYNQRWYDYTNTTPDQMEGWGWESVHDEMLPTVVERWRASLETGTPFEMEFPLKEPTAPSGGFSHVSTRCGIHRAISCVGSGRTWMSTSRGALLRSCEKLAV